MCPHCHADYPAWLLRKHEQRCDERPVPKAQVTLDAAKEHCKPFVEAVKGGNEWNS